MLFCLERYLVVMLFCLERYLVVMLFCLERYLVSNVVLFRALHPQERTVKSL